MIRLDSGISPISHKKIAKGLVILVVILFIGSVGYMLIEGWDFLDSLYMTVRGLNPGLFILARAADEHTEKKLLRGGANKVVMPYLIGGQKMAQTIIKPAVTDFIECPLDDKEMGLDMGELVVSEKSRLNGANLIDSGIRQEMDVIIVAIRTKEGEIKLS